ncbi:MAG: hypothetical protein V4683_14835 [Bacteroidota bacterium]
MEKTTQSKKTVKPVAKKVTVKNNNNLEIKSIATEVKNVATEIAEEIKAEVNKVDFTDNVEKIKDSAKALNTQFKVSATEIVDEVKDITVEVSKVANKTVKQIAKKVDVKGNVAKAKKVATKLNNQLVENVEDFKNTSTKLANEMVENFNVTDRMEKVKKSINNANEIAVKNTSDLIDGIDLHVGKWQVVAEKAIKTGLKLVDNQSNMVFTTLEAMKAQAGKTTNRFKKLFA